MFSPIFPLHPSITSLAAFFEATEDNARKRGKEIALFYNGLIRGANMGKAEKWRFLIFSPLLYQLSYPANMRSTTAKSGCRKQKG
jgi:hypothetical protein